MSAGSLQVYRRQYGVPWREAFLPVSTFEPQGVTRMHVGLYLGTTCVSAEQHLVVQG